MKKVMILFITLSLVPDGIFAGACPPALGCTVRDRGVTAEVTAVGETSCTPWGAWGPWGRKTGFPWYLRARVRFRTCSRTITYQDVHRCDYWCRSGELAALAIFSSTHNHGGPYNRVETWREEDSDLNWFDPPDTLWEERSLVYDGNPYPVFYHNKFSIDGTWIDQLPGVASHGFSLDGTPVVEDAPFDFTPFGQGRHTLELLVSHSDGTVGQWEFQFEAIADIRLQAVDTAPVLEEGIPSMRFMIHNHTQSPVVPEGSPRKVLLSLVSPPGWTAYISPNNYLEVYPGAPTTFTVRLFPSPWQAPTDLVSTTDTMPTLRVQAETIKGQTVMLEVPFVGDLGTTGDSNTIGTRMLQQSAVRKAAKLTSEVCDPLTH